MKNIFLIFLFLGNYTAQCQKQINNIRCIEATSIFPVFTKNGDVSKYDTGKIKFYFFGSRRLYDLQYEFTHKDNGKIIVSEIRRHFVVFEKDSAYGIDLNLTTGVKKRVKLDSLFKNEWFVKNKLYPILTSNISILKDSIRKRNLNALVVNYDIRRKIDTLLIGKCKFSFTNEMKDFDLSLSRELDSIFKMKLFEVEILNLSQYFKESNYILKQFKTFYALKETIVFDRNNILKYFNMYLEQN